MRKCLYCDKEALPDDDVCPRCEKLIYDARIEQAEMRKQRIKELDYDENNYKEEK